MEISERADKVLIRHAKQIQAFENYVPLDITQWEIGHIQELMRSEFVEIFSLEGKDFLSITNKGISYIKKKKIPI